MNDRINGIAKLTHLGVIRATGADAASFLQGQLTQDFLLLPTDAARLAAYCNPKGRMLASFIGWRQDADNILLVCERDLLAPTLKRLSMYVLRAKVRLTDASSEFALYGLLGSAARDAAQDPCPPWHKQPWGDATVISLPGAADQARALLLTAATAQAPTGEPACAEQWRWAEVASGVAPIVAATSEAFVPQMLNYESVGGVNFKKGCYPGQEVVARSQFRGVIKRRAFRVHSEQELAPGMEVFHDSDPVQPCGQVALAAPAPEGGFEAIVSMQVSAANGGTLHATDASGPVLRLLELPYALLEDI